MDSTAPRTLLEAVTYFADADRALKHFVKVRWPNGVACPRMGCGNAHVQFVATRKLWRCKECKRQFTAKVGTIFEDSPISFSKWLPAVWLLANTKNGTSSHELGRALGVTQKTAWFMLHRIRVAMRLGSFDRQLSGEVEADETYVGGKPRRPNVGRSNMHRKGSGHVGKAVVMGMIERGGRVRAFMLPDAKNASLLPKIAEHVAPGTTLYTDALQAYRFINHDHYTHRVINHAVKYVEGRVHTNSIENFWSCFKRTLHGTYIAPQPFHLGAYVDEQVFRFNARKGNDADRFLATLKGADGRRLTYAALTASHPLWRLKPGRSARALANRQA